MNRETRAPAPLRHSAWKVWSNPIFLRYCRSRLRPGGLGVALLAAVLISGFMVGMSTSIGVRGEMSPSDAARPAIMALLVFQAFILFIFGTAQVGGGMTAERDEGVIDYQRLIPMSPLSKVVGYLLGLPVREYAMFLATLPFTAWCLWRGGVSWHVWFPLYGTVLSSALLYHLTGLVTGMVVKNRRWAFLISIGLVLCLYTVIPQAAKFGLVFFKYLTITPVYMESLPHLLPESAGRAVGAVQNLIPTVKFFGLDFSEAVFTWFSQGGLILTFVIMLCRRWKRAESHLLGKFWATGFFAWVQVLLLGNALPLIEPGSLFPSRGWSRMLRMGASWKPESWEAVAMSGMYGFVTLGLVFVLSGIITPTADAQLRGWRRARKKGEHALPFRSDEATSFWCVLVMALAGAAGWFVFTRGLVESRWFPGHEVPFSLFLHFAAVLLGCGIAFQSLLESRGARAVGMATIFVGIVPIMAGAILGTIQNRWIPIAVWLIGISPLSTPFDAAGGLLSISDLPPEAARAVPRAFYFWLGVLLIAAVKLAVGLLVARRALATASERVSTDP